MVRLVRHTATGPYKIEPGTLPADKAIFICCCGLSQKQPFCDGSHKGCIAEEPGKVYRYSADGKSIQSVAPDDSPPVE